MKRERLDRERGRAGERRLDRDPLDGLHGLDQRARVVGHRRRRRAAAAPAAPTRHGTSTTARASRKRQRRAVGDVEDPDRALVGGDRLDHGQRLGLVAARLALRVRVALVAVAGLGHVRAVALVLRRAPERERLLGRLRPRRVEARLLLEQVGAARAAAERLDGLGREVEVVEVLVRDHAERAQPLGAEQPALLERVERGVVGEQLRQPLARSRRARPSASRGG